MCFNLVQQFYLLDITNRDRTQFFSTYEVRFHAEYNPNVSMEVLKLNTVVL